MVYSKNSMQRNLNMVHFVSNRVLYGLKMEYVLVMNILLKAFCTYSHNSNTNPIGIFFCQSSLFEAIKYQIFQKKVLKLHTLWSRGKGPSHS